MSDTSKHKENLNDIPLESEIMETSSDSNTSNINIEKVPKVKSDDDVEEFDTDEEDEEEKKTVEEKSVPYNDTSSDYSKHLTYEGDICIYTDPSTKKQMIWDTKENAWVPRDSDSTASEINDPMKDYEFDGKNYVYTDKTNNITYKFDQEKNEWVVKEDTDNDESLTKDSENRSGPAVANPGGTYGFENDTHTYTDPNDGTSYIWDKEKSAWFPKVDDDFMARYQMSYGFIDSSTIEAPKPEIKTKADVKVEKEQKKAEAKRKAAEPPTWFEVDEAHNTAVYISNLPNDITMDELIEMVTKFGLLARDDKNKDKIKLYKDKDDQPKGDALCTYIKVESVDLALKVLDGSQLRGKTISVQRAKFQMKGQYDPALKPKKKKRDKERQKKIQEKLFDWRPERLPGEPQKNERVVIIKNLFTPEDFDKDVQLLLEYQQDVRSECTKCGEVKKVTIYDRHPEGVAQVTFREPEHAQACIQLLNGRWFGQRKISAEIWDGKTKYKIAETDAEIEARIDKWDKFLDDEDEKKEAAKNATVKETI